VRREPDLRSVVRLLLGLVALLATPAPAQESPSSSNPGTSRYLPLGHWAYPYIHLLRDRGPLKGLQPLVQPYRRVDVASAVRRAMTASNASRPERGWLAELEREFAPELAVLKAGAGADASQVSGGFSIGQTAVTSRHRDPLRSAGDPAAFVFSEADLAATFPSLVAALRFRWDEWLLNDPQFPDGIVVEQHPNFLGFLDFGARAEDAYFELQLPYFRLFAGRLSRNWGLPGTLGLLVSDYSYSYDQVAYRLGSDRLGINGFVAQLDEWPDNTKRWLSEHRLDWQLSDRLTFSAAEAVTFGGVNRSFDFRMANPLSVWVVGGFGISWLEGPNANNNFTELSLRWSPGSWLVSYLGLMIDEMPGGGTPLAHGLQLGLRFPRLGPTTALRLDYSQLGAVTYRSIRPYERFAFRDIGIGRDLADHDLLSATLDWMPGSRLMVSPTVHLLRRGEGDFRDPWPADADANGPVLFVGQVETTLRAAVRGQWRSGPRALVEWDLGENLRWNADHTPGLHRAQFVARARLGLTFRSWGRL